MKPVIHSGDFQWNIDFSVGKGGMNSHAPDVTYIQWYYTLAAKNPYIAPDRKAVYSMVQVTGTCTGNDRDPLVQAIIAHQRHLKHPQIDGRVSVAHGDGKVGTSAFFVYRIGARLADMFPELWPRIDLVPGCPVVIVNEVTKAIPVLPPT